MGKNPTDIRESVKQTVSQLSDTVDALSSKVDVGRVKDTLDDATENVRGRLADGASAVRSKIGDVSDALPAPDDVRAGAMNPYVLGIGLLAAGFLGGLLVPLTSLERRRLAPIGQDIARRAVEARDEIVDQSKAVVSETLSAAQESAQKHGKELAGNLGIAESASA